MAAAQAVLDSVERREAALRTALRTHKKDLRRLNKKAERHRSTLNGLKADLKKIKSSRVAIVDKS